MQLHHVEGLNRLEVRNNLEVVDGKELVYLSGNSGRTLGVVSKWQKLQLKSFFFVFQLLLFKFHFGRREGWGRGNWGILDVWEAEEWYLLFSFAFRYLCNGIKIGHHWDVPSCAEGGN